MTFEDFVKEGKAIKGQKDTEKSKALIKMSDNNIRTASSIEVTEVTSSTVFVISYEALREMIEAICLLEGWKVYSHEAFTEYLIRLGEDEISARFDRLRKLRNGANYYGKEVTIATTNDAKKEIAKMCEYLKNKYLNRT